MGETGLLDRKRCRVYLRDEREPLVYTMIKGMLVVARKKSDKTWVRYHGYEAYMGEELEGLIELKWAWGKQH